VAADDLPAERNIPILPCRSIDDQLAFYEAIGFEVTYRQKAPNVFAAVRRGPIELQFFTMKGYEPANSYSTCYVLTADVDRLYAEFRDGLKRALGRVPSRGIPRIGALNDMSYGVRQFVMTDPGGNMIRIGQPITTEVEPRASASKSRLEKAFEAASLLLHSKEDPATAARVIDDALDATSDAPAALLARARILSADAAHALGDDARAAARLGEVTATELSDADREAIRDDLDRADELRASLSDA
jgi:catechol 2,3-dioxygenase-like lactoylglutathione lyase family enzyme